MRTRMKDEVDDVSGLKRDPRRGYASCVTGHVTKVDAVTR